MEGRINTVIYGWRERRRDRGGKEEEGNESRRVEGGGGKLRQEVKN